jgi:opacity protein-like surface antigen
MSFTAYDFQGNPVATTSVETNARDLALFSGVKFSFPVNSPKVFPYARGGLGLNFVDVSVESQGISVSGGDTDLGIYLGGGVDFLVSRSMMVGGELLYHATDADHTLLGVTMSFPLGHHFQERAGTSSSKE